MKLVQMNIYIHIYIYVYIYIIYPVFLFPKNEIGTLPSCQLLKLLNFEGHFDGNFVLDQSTDLSVNFWQFLLAPPNSHWQLELYLPTEDAQYRASWNGCHWWKVKITFRNIPSWKNRTKTTSHWLLQFATHQLLETLNPPQKKETVRQRYIFGMQAPEVCFCVRCIWTTFGWMRLRVGDETSQISAAPFHISFLMPMAKCCGCFSRIRKKMISNKFIRYNPGWMG